MNTQHDSSTSPRNPTACTDSRVEAEVAVDGVYTDLTRQTGVLRHNDDESLMPPDLVWGYVWDMIGETYQIGDAWYGSVSEENPAPFDEVLVERLHGVIWDYVYSHAVAAADHPVTVQVLDKAWFSIFNAFEEHDLIPKLQNLADQSTS